MTSPNFSTDMKMAWRNVWRNPRRTWLTVSAISFACMVLIFMLSFQFGSYETMINSSVKINTGHIQVQAKGYFDKKSMRRVVDSPEAVIRMISRIDYVEAVTARASTFSLVSSKDRTYGAVVVGIDPVLESKVSTLKSLIRKGRFLSDMSENENSDKALIGTLLAQNLKVGLDDELTILGQGRDGSVAATILKVAGIYESGLDALDRSTLHIPLKTFQAVYAMGNAVHEIIVNVDSLHDVPMVKQDIVDGLKAIPDGKNFVVMDWDELVPGLTQAIEIDLTMGLVFWVLLVVVVAFSILNTFLMAIFERTREFGVMMAIGTTPGRLVKLLLYESNFMTMTGITLGVLIGCGLTLIFQIYGIDVSGSSEILKQYGITGRIYPRLSLITAFAGPLLVWMITLTVALYPALKIKRLRPVEAMVHV